MTNNPKSRGNSLTAEDWLSHPFHPLVFIFLLAMAVQVLNVSIIGIPIPFVHDEFAYVLGADTFAHGRLANPTHPLWPFFESIHILSHPTYAPKYPPAQAFFLAVGQVLFGIPWVGAALSAALLVSATFWTLKAVVPYAWAFWASIFVMLHYSLGHYWSLSYWGGAITALGAMLALGSYLYSRRATPVAIWQCCIGGLLLAFSRPFEGAFFIAGLGLCAAWDTFKGTLVLRGAWKPLWLKCAATAAVFFCVQGYYDWRVTGSPWLTPYVLYHQQYEFDPLLWAQTPTKPEGAAVDIIQHTNEMAKGASEIAAMPWLERSAWLFLRLGLLIHAEFLWITELFVVMLLFTGCDTLTRRLLAISGISLIPVFLANGSHIHYVAPFIAAIIPALVHTLRRFCAMLKHPLISGTMIVVCALSALCPLYHMNMPREWYEKEMVFARKRQAMLHDLGSKGSQLVFVRYGPGYFVGRDQGDWNHEWIQNGADIDAQTVVWAHDMGSKNKKLCHYYPDRTAWLLTENGPTWSIAHYACPK